MIECKSAGCRRKQAQRFAFLLWLQTSMSPKSNPKISFQQPSIAIIHVVHWTASSFSWKFVTDGDQAVSWTRLPGTAKSMHVWVSLMLLALNLEQTKDLHPPGGTTWFEEMERTTKQVEPTLLYFRSPVDSTDTRGDEYQQPHSSRTRRG